MNLPKGYLSWSQLDLWEKNKQKYIEQYFEGKKGFENKEMRFGKFFAECVEAQKSDDPLVSHLIKILPKRSHSEAELNVNIDEIPLKMVFDSADKVGFDEYKTGKVPWTRERADSHGQLDFYALGFFKEFGFIPEIALHWLPTADSEAGICFTGEVHSFVVVKNLGHLNDMEARIRKAVQEISDYKSFAKKIVKI